MALSIVGYGWVLHTEAHVSISLILQFVQGFCSTRIYLSSSTLLKDIHPKTPETAAAASSIVLELHGGNIGKE